jgi:glucosamine--fructose-6-phosphate aminotransferase (isomerizing)
MCGIVGYIGPKQATDVVVKGLSALEYRGYDSVGVALIDQNQTGQVIKQAGRVENLKPLVKQQAGKSQLAIGHTRWATHGLPNSVNAHPHSNNAKDIFVVHNGIIENYQEIKDRLTEHGYKFYSDTDTEVIPNLIDYYTARSKTFLAGLKAALNDLRGAFAIAVITTREPTTLFAARFSSPLVIGVGNNEYVLASDPNAIMAHTKDVVFLEDNDLAVINQTSLKIIDFSRSMPKKPKLELLDYDQEQAALGHFPNFMLKEIYEAPQTIRAATRGRVLADQGIIKLGGLESVNKQLNHIDRIVIVACGTSYYAGLVGEYLIEELANIPVEVQLASEFKYRKEPFSRATILLAISQSGETADTIAALEKAKDFGCLRLGVVNAIGSTIARLTDAGVYTHAGAERAVASTKAFIAQVTVLTLIALHLSKGENKDYRKLLNELSLLPQKAAAVLEQAPEIKRITIKYMDKQDFFFIGRGYNYPCALEGALKLKEISYIHAEGYAAGEMKHGPLALIDKDFPTLALATDSNELAKTISNIEEIKTRNGPLIIMASAGNKKVASLTDDLIYLPKTMEQTQPILSAIALQLFAYYIAEAKQLDIDHPRNLAKSVTVE